MIKTTEVSITYKGDGVQTSFPYPYPYRNSDDIVGYIINDVGYEKRITNNFKYDKVSNIYQYPLAGDPLAAPYSIKLIRETPQQQNADLPEKLPFSLIEKSLDWIIMILQEIGSRCNSLWHIRNDCKLSETNARNSASAAAESEENAANSEDMAKKWAMSPASPDGVVDTNSPTGYTQSAKIWAALSKEYAGLSKFKLPIGYYNSVDEMKASETAIVGRPCVTLGYYESNDGGGAVYIIRSKKENDVDDGGSTIVLDNENVAELLIDGDINVKQFGAYGNGADNDTDAFTKAISFASSGGHNILIPHGKYNITTIEIPANVSLYGFGASIYSEAELTFDIKSNASANRSFIDNINFYAKNPITIETGRKVTINECSFYNVTGTGINVKNGYEHDIRNCDFYGSGTNCIAIRMAAGDSRIDNCIMIDCYVGITVVDKSCYISNVHAWINSPILLRGSLMFDFGEGNLFINQCCCDTYHYVFKKKGYNRVVFNELYVINNYGIWAQGMNEDEKNILTSTSNLNYLVSVKMIGCNIPMKIKTNDANDILPIFIDDTSYAPYIYTYISDITYDTTLAEKTETSRIIIKGNVMIINIACTLLKNTKSMQYIGSMSYPAEFNNTIVFTGVVCAAEISEMSAPVGIAYIRIVNNKIYVSTSEDYTGKILLASTTIYTSKT